MRGQWEERFERRCGFWRGFVDEQVRRYLDCGLVENGFARIRCPDCAEEYLLAFSCKTRELCPSCGSEVKVIAFITEHDVVDAILRHLAKPEVRSPRGPPGGATLPATSFAFDFCTRDVLEEFSRHGLDPASG